MTTTTTTTTARARSRRALAKTSRARAREDDARARAAAAAHAPAGRSHVHPARERRLRDKPIRPSSARTVASRAEWIIPRARAIDRATSRARPHVSTCARASANA